MMIAALPSIAMDPTHESTNVAQVFAGKPVELLQFFSNQLSVLKNEAVSLLSLCGLAITVTGFSGAHMIRAGSIAAAAMVFGIAMILVAAIIALRTLTRVRWVSQDLQSDLHATARSIIERRNQQQRRLSHAGVFVALGLAGYLAAVCITAFS